jgi:hypothetical protein
LRLSGEPTSARTTPRRTSRIGAPLADGTRDGRHRWW